MKSIKVLLLLLVGLVMTACGGDNLESYKEKSLDLMAKQARSTTEQFIKDYNVVVDSLVLHSLTVKDSIAVIRNECKNKEAYQNDIKILQKQLRSFFNFDEEGDRKRIKTLEEKLKKIDEFERKLPEYEAMSQDLELCKFFSFRFSAFVPLLGRKTGPEAFVFTRDGSRIIDNASKFLTEYFQKEKQE